jgi:hypothetical protein
MKEKCVRCGVCCSTGACEVGKENEFGICVFLMQENKNLFSCKLLVNHKIKSSTIGVGVGCVLKETGFYEYYKQRTKEIREYVKSKCRD